MNKNFVATFEIIKYIVFHFKKERKPNIFNGRDKVIAVKRLNDLGNKPVTIICPFCEEKVVTDIEHSCGTLVFLFE